MKEIKVYSKKHGEKVILIDDEDFDFLNQWKWFVFYDGHNFYAVRNIRSDGKRSIIRMHRLLTDAKEGQMIDHKDGNSLNNQKNNLRVASRSQNMANRSKVKGGYSQYLGVSWYKDKQMFSAHIRFNGKLKYLGLFVSEKDAAVAYNEAAAKTHGEFARLNIIG